MVFRRSCTITRCGKRSLFSDLIYDGREKEMAVINGNREPEAVGKILADYLREKGYAMTRIAVECSGEIIPRSRYEEKVIGDGEIIEIVSFVGGG